MTAVRALTCAVLSGACILALTTSAGLAHASVVPASAQRAAASCDGQDPNNVPPASIRYLEIAVYRDESPQDPGSSVDLRYSIDNKCAWGRLDDGHLGDEVWTDREHPDGSGYQGMLGYTKIISGNEVYTAMWNDDNLLMRACANRAGGNPGTIRCTGWH